MLSLVYIYTHTHTRTHTHTHRILIKGDLISRVILIENWEIIFFQQKVNQSFKILILNVTK